MSQVLISARGYINSNTLGFLGLVVVSVHVQSHASTIQHKVFKSYHFIGVTSFVAIVL
jgi:hypothetical protein